MEKEIMDNQIQEELDYILPDDYEEEAEETTEAEMEESEVTEATEETEVVEEAEETTEEVEESEETEESEEVAESLDDLEVKYLHEVKKLKDIPKDELKTLVQKGMNHDRVQEKYTIINDKFNQIKELSNLYNMDEDTLIKTLYDQYYQNAAEAEGTTPEAVKSRVESRKKDASQKMYERFATKFPDVGAKDIPKEVWDEVANGEDLSKAYSEHLRTSEIRSKEDEINQLKTQMAELEKKLKVKSQNEKVKKKAVVKSTSKHGSDDIAEDEFLQGLLGD